MQVQEKEKDEEDENISLFRISISPLLAENTYKQATYAAGLIVTY
jgi:hypothetical protein